MSNSGLKPPEVERPRITPTVSFNLPPTTLSRRPTSQNGVRRVQSSDAGLGSTEEEASYERDEEGMERQESEKDELSDVTSSATRTPPANIDGEEQETRPQRPPLHSRRTTGAPRLSMTVPLKRSHTRLAQKEAHPWQHLGITLGGPMIILFDLVVPCIIYYTWYDQQRSQWQNECNKQFPNTHPCPLVLKEYNSDIMGSAIASFGFGELWILIARVYRLFVRREECAPLLSRNRWELDATSWVYGTAMIVALIPFVVGSSLVIPELYLYGPSFIMGFLGILMVATFFPIPLPVGINSQPRGGTLRPFIYYAAEDFIAVDALQDREFRVRFNERYEESAMFRKFFRMLTLWWLLGVCVYIGAASAIIWTLPFHYAFGLTFGVLFSYIAVWAGCTILWVNWEMEREKKAFEKMDAEDEGVLKRNV